MSKLYLNSTLNTLSRFFDLLRGISCLCLTRCWFEYIIIALQKVLGTTLFPGTVTAMESDPSLDWLIMGLSNGSLMFYDVDRVNLTPFRIDNLQKKIMPKEKMSPVLSIEWHPRDIGTLLIAYQQSAIVTHLYQAK